MRQCSSCQPDLPLGSEAPQWNSRRQNSSVALDHWLHSPARWPLDPVIRISRAVWMIRHGRRGSGWTVNGGTCGVPFRSRWLTESEKSSLNCCESCWGCKGPHSRSSGWRGLRLHRPIGTQLQHFLAFRSDPRPKSAGFLVKRGPPEKHQGV